MRVKISTSAPLPPLKAWFPLHGTESTISSFKTLLCASLPVLRNISSSSLRLSIDGYELLDSSELVIIRDGDLICIDALDTPCEDATVPLGRVVAQAASQTVPAGSGTAASYKRKRRVSESSSSSSSDTDSDVSPWPPKRRVKILQQARGCVSHAVRTGSEPTASVKQKRRMSTSGSSSSTSDSQSTTSESESDTSDEDSTSESADSDDSSRPTTLKVEPIKIQAREGPEAKSHIAQPTTFVPPGYGKPQTRSRNLRRRLKRMHGRDSAGLSEEGPVSGANAAVPEKKSTAPATVDAMAGLMSLSLRNKNKAKNFRALIGKPLPPKIIFGDQEGDGSTEMATPECPTPAEDTCKPQTSSTRAVPRLIPPSSRSSLPPNLFVTSVDVEVDLHREKKKRKTSEEEVTEVVASGGDARLESLAEERWETLVKLTSEKQVTPGTAVGYKALGINPITYTPEYLLTVGHVQSCDVHSVLLRPLRERENISFSGPVDEGDAEVAVQEHTWADILAGDWRVIVE